MKPLNQYLDDIVSAYIDALNSGNAPAPARFLERFPGLAPSEAFELIGTLQTLYALRVQPSLEERRRECWRQLERRMKTEVIIHSPSATRVRPGRKRP